ncbi:NADH:flavin oxidoreductase [Streptococcus suis]|uniref:oxidoreductase n=1 Tax=Streptococcus suis TaxID=1307 RepID=UPI0022AA0791|nr:NADH:flavin oxidoreductase [Streptococcus suis]
MNQTPIAPSAIPISGGSASAFRPPREMTVFDIKEARDKFIAAGLRAKAAGFTGVQLHAAHGYLINQFLSPADNQRMDRYGGSLDNRMRFLVEVYQGLRDKVGPDFTIALKLNASDFKEEGFGFEDCKHVVKTMSDLGIDLIEISGGNYETPVFGSDYENGAGFVTYALALADLTSVPIVSTGGFRKVTQMEEAIKDGVSMIGLARPFVLRPSLVSDYRQIGDVQLITPRLTTGLPKLDKALGPIIGVSYYEAQMKRLAKGKSVTISHNAWPYLLQTVKAHGLSALKPRRK